MPKLTSGKITVEERNLLHHFLGFFFFFLIKRSPLEGENVYVTCFFLNNDLALICFFCLSVCLLEFQLLFSFGTTLEAVLMSFSCS